MSLAIRMNRYYTKERFLGLALIILSVLAGHFARLHDVFYIAPFYVVLVIVADIAGFRMALLAATLFSIGAYLQWFEYNSTRFWVNLISLFTIAWIVGGLKRKARIIDTLNGNLDLLWHIVREIDYLIIHWHTLSDKSKYLRVVEIKSAAVDLTTNVLGWKKLADLRTANDKLNTQELNLDDYDNQAKDKGNQEV